MTNLGMVAYSMILAELADLSTLKLFEKDGFMSTRFSCSTNVWNVQATKDFLDKHYTKIADPCKRIRKGYTMNAMDDFDWESELSLK